MHSWKIKTQVEHQLDYVDNLGLTFLCLNASVREYYAEKPRRCRGSGISYCYDDWWYPVHLLIKYTL